MSKNPKTPPGPLASTSEEDLHFYSVSHPLFRIHSVTGSHPMPWNGLRSYGPLSQSRWDPQPPPPQQHTDNGVTYTATEPVTAFAEAFQTRRHIRITHERAISAWFPQRTLRLLDLTGYWAIHNGASASLHAAPKTTTRNWARRINEELVRPMSLDGLYAPSTMTLKPVVVLFDRAKDAFPPTPTFSRLLTHKDSRVLAGQAAVSLGWPLL